MLELVVIHFLLNAVVRNAVEECDKLAIIIDVKNAETKREMRRLNLKRICSVNLVMEGCFGNVRIY